MLTNSNRIGKYGQLSTEWNGGVVDVRTHHGAMASNRYSNAYNYNENTEENGFLIGRYTGKSFSVLAQETALRNLYVSDDGTRMYIVGTTNDRIYQYSMSTPYDVSTASFVNFFAFGTTVVDPTGLYISPDGTKLFVLASTSDTVFSYTFGTAWDVTTLTYDSKSFLVTQEATPWGLTVQPDGTKFWVVGSTNDRVYEYTMSTAWDLATASYTSISLLVSVQDTTPIGLAWNSTGTVLMVCGATSDTIYSYTTATPWTVSGAVLAVNSGSANSVVPVETVTAVNGFYFVPGTKNHYVLDNGTDKVYWFTSRVVDNLSSGVNSNRLGLSESLSLGIASPRTVYFRPDGMRFYVADGTTSTIREFRCLDPWTLTGATQLASHVLQARTSTAVFGSISRFWFSSDGTDVYFVDFTNGTMSRYGLVNAWDLSQMYFKNSVTSAISASSNAWCFTRDGLSLIYVSGTTFFRKSLSTAWDITTLSAATSFSDSVYLGTSNTLTGVYMNQTGEYLYGLTAATARVYKYKLSTPFNITTASFYSHAYIEDVSPDPLGGLFMSTDGTYLFNTDQTNDSIYRWVLNGA